MEYKKSRVFCVFSLCVFSYSLILPSCAAQPGLPDIAEVLAQVEFKHLSAEAVDAALPRSYDESLLLRLRGQGVTSVHAIDLDEENNLRKCLLVGAYFTAACWDWRQFMRMAADTSTTTSPDSRPKSVWFRKLKQLKFGMEGYLSQINHRLDNLGAPKFILAEIDSMKQNFEASKDNLQRLPFAEISSSLQTISDQVRVFMQSEAGHGSSFALGDWLVWQAELSNLHLVVAEENRPNLRAVMNTSFRGVDVGRFAELSSRMFDTGKSEQSRIMGDSLRRLTHLFMIENVEEVRQVRTEVFGLFELLDLEFPSLK